MAASPQALPPSSSTWLYYDFAGNWGPFWRAWSSNLVQDLLGQRLRAWCARQGLPDRGWRPGDPLWQLSSVPWWLRTAEQQARDFALKHSLLRRYEEAMARLGRRFPTRAAARAAFEAVCLPQLVEDFLPKPGTVEALLLMGGRNEVVLPALELAAQALFPGERLSVGGDTAGNGIFAIEGRRLLFDPYGYVFCKMGKPGYDAEQCAAELLDQMQGWLFGPNDVM